MTGPTPRWLYWPMTTRRYQAMPPADRAGFHHRRAATAFRVMREALAVGAVCLVLLAALWVAGPW